MKPTTENSVSVQSNLAPTETGEFTIDQQSLGHIMSVLTNLYKDPEKAVIREYITNAWDSHVEAGQTRPIEVTTPSRWQKMFKVKDYGIGMSVADLKNIYSRYGASTKRHTNEQVGMLGLGSKSALTYTNAFTIVAIKNGVRATASINLNEMGTPVFNIVDTAATDEPNGVEFSISVKTSNSFEEKTKDFLSFWKPGQVLLNGAEPAHFDLPEARPGVFVRQAKNDYYSQTPKSYVVMGNVPYEVDEEHIDPGFRNANMGFIAYVPIGAVTIPPAREGIIYTPETTKTVEAISKGLFEDMVAKKVAEITAVPSKQTAYVQWANLAYHFKQTGAISGMEYRPGHRFTDVKRGPYLGQNRSLVGWELYRRYDGNSSLNEEYYLDVPDLLSRCALIVTGADLAGNKPTAYVKKKIFYYMEQQNIRVGDNRIFITKDDPTEWWLTDIPRIDIATIKAIKLPKNPSAAGPRNTAPVPYDTYRYTGNSTQYLTEVNVTGKTVAYISPSEYRDSYTHSGTTPQGVIGTIKDPDLTLVVLGTNRTKKFLETNPNAVHLKTLMAKYVKDAAAKATAFEFMGTVVEHQEQQFIEAVPLNRIEDPDLLQFVKDFRAGTKTSFFQQAKNIHAQASRCRINVPAPVEPKVKTPHIRQYALLRTAGRGTMDHLVFYVNAYYNAFLKPKKK